MDASLPPFVSRLGRGTVVVELAAGRRFETALAVAEAHPGIEVQVMDVDPRVREAPSPLVPFVDDLTKPDLGRYRGAAALYAVRLPEELQASAIALARSVHAPLFVRALKDEWAEVPGERAGTPAGGGWRAWYG